MEVRGRFSAQDWFQLIITRCSVGGGYQPTILGVSPILHLQLYWLALLVFDKQCVLSFLGLGYYGRGLEPVCQPPEGWWQSDGWKQTTWLLTGQNWSEIMLALKLVLSMQTESSLVLVALLNHFTLWTNLC
eukprot:Gb_28540 [translate_table: standard]